MKLTEKEEKILEFIRQKSSFEGMPPTLREIQDHFGYKAVGTVQDHIKSLEKKGALIREKRKARGIRLSGRAEEGRRSNMIPLLGRIAAGVPVESEESIMGYIPDFMCEGIGKPLFALRVSGESMIEAGIFDGDTAVLEKSETAEHGDIVAVCIYGETTLKEIRKTPDGKIIFVPKNSSMKPIEYQGDDPANLKIVGKMIGLYRKYI